MADLFRKNQLGFTLIELLVAVAIIGILASMGISHFTLYKQKAANACAQSDLKAGIIAQEAEYTDSQTYITCATVQECEELLPGFVGTKRPNGESAMSTFSFIGDEETFSGNAAHWNGSYSYHYSNQTGAIAAVPL